MRKWNGGALSNAEPSRSWIFQYRIGAQSRRVLIGQVSAIKVQAAREIAAKYHLEVIAGQDPAAQKIAAKSRAADTLGGLIQKYLDRQQTELRPGSMTATTRYLQKHCASLHRVPIDSVDRKLVAGVLANVEKTSGAPSANRTRTALSACFSWAMREGLAASNPVMGTSQRQEKPRERVLSTAELRLIWNSLRANEYGVIVKLLLLTGARLNEVAKLRWSEIDFDRGVISLPGTRVKNGLPHEVPMSETVRALLASQPKNGRETVFVSLGEARYKAQLDDAITAANGGKPIPHWTHHDLRRTCATHMAELGVQPHIVEAVLNHISGHKAGVAGIYNRAAYRDEKREALDRWDAHVGKIVA
jgi:integrase